MANKKKTGKNRVEPKSELFDIFDTKPWLNDIGRKVKAKGIGGKIEYGLVVHYDWEEQGNIAVLWDNPRPGGDYEGYLGATFLSDAPSDYEFEFIDKKGKPINRIELEDGEIYEYKPRRSHGDKRKNKR